MPLWQAETMTTVGRVPQPASRALFSALGCSKPLAALSATPLSRPWLVTNTKQACPLPLRSADEMFAVLATFADGLRSGSDVRTCMSLTPRAASLSRSASMPLSKAGLLFSPAIRTARQPGAGIESGWAGAELLWVDGGVPVARRAEAAGLRVVMNRCHKIEHSRLAGTIEWHGIASGVISSKKRAL